MPSTIRYFISACLVLASGLGFSQTKDAPKKNADVEPKATAKKKPVKPKKDFTPTGIRVGTDLIDLGKTFGGKTFQGWELNGDIDFANYYLAADIGSWSKDVTLTNGEYTNGGNYFRVGADINLLGKDPDKNMFFFGFRYGRAMFHEALNYSATSPVYPSSPYQVSSANVSGGWGEITSGLRVKIWKGLWMGYTARLKFAPSVKGNDPSLATYDMPGYGIVSQKPWWGFNYQLFWKFAWKKDKPVVKK